MIDLYAWHTPNGRKPAILLEELGLPYRVIPVDISKGDQHDPDFLSISPNNKIPAIVDHDAPGNRPLALFESGAILVYLAEKAGRLLPTDPRERAEVMQWLMWQMAGFGPMLGQAHHFLRHHPHASEYAARRYGGEARRLYTVLDTHLRRREWVAAGRYTIADIAIYPWVMRHEWQGIDLAVFPYVLAWANRVGAREAVKVGMRVCS